MRKRILFLTGALALLGALSGMAVGCEAATCESACEQRKACGTETAADDCATLCLTEERVAEDTGCGELYEARLSCIGTATNCTADTFCAAQEAAYLNCVGEACADTPEKCSGAGGSGGTGAGGGGGSGGSGGS